MMPQDFSGQELGAMLRQAARDAGLSIDKFAAPLAQQPNKWLSQMELIERPRAQTVARVLALIEGRSELPPPANATQFNRRRDQPTLAERAVTVEECPAPIERDPCLRCGVRADLHADQGCNRWRGA